MLLTAAETPVLPLDSSGSSCTNNTTYIH